MPVQIGKIFKAEAFVKNVADNRDGRGYRFICNYEEDHQKQRKVLLSYEIGHDKVDDERTGDCDSQS